MRAENVQLKQRVRVYWVSQRGVLKSWVGTVLEIADVRVRVSQVGWFHCSQLRLLKPKKKQPRALDGRRWWANEYPGWPCSGAYTTRESADDAQFPGRTALLELAIVARHPVGKGE